MTYDTVITNSHVVTGQGLVDKNIIIDDGKIIGLTTDTPSCDEKINGHGLVSIPGVIDTHVHYGVYSPINVAAVTESRVAALVGVTTMMRMLRLGDSYKRSLASQLEASAVPHFVVYTFPGSFLNKQQNELLRLPQAE